MTRRSTPTAEDLTIALCTIGRPGFLEAAIESLLATTPPGVSFHLVLNGCEPGTLERLRPLLDRWDGPLRVTEVDERVAIHQSHGLALDAATTRLITFMGDDDIVLEPRVERLLHRFDDEPAPLVVGSFARRAGGTPAEPVLLGRKDLGPTTVAEWRQWVEQDRFFELCFPAAIIDVEAARAVGGFDPDFGPVMDVGLFTRLAARGPVIVDPHRGFGYRIHDQSLSTADGVAVAERYRYVETVIGAERRGEPAPSFEQFRAHEADAGVLDGLVRRRRVAAQLHFRRAGSAMLGGRRWAAVGHLVASALTWPPVFVAKVRDQFGRRRPPTPDQSVVTVAADRRDREGDRAVAALGSDAPVVSVLIKGLYHYRLGFYRHLRLDLARRGIRLRLLHGQGSSEDRSKGDVVALTWSELRPVRAVRLGGREVLWQRGLADARRSDLIVCEQASRLLLNYPLLLAKRALGTRVALWGHGRNLKAGHESRVGEALKRFLTGRADWFFAYNDLGARQVQRMGYPRDRITAVQNSSDTVEISTALAALSPEVIEARRRQLGIGEGPVALFMGGLYDLKRPGFLVDAAIALRRLAPEAHLVVMGDGPEARLVADAAATHDWIHHLGPVFGPERIEYAALADVFLLPGLVGLNVVDAFALGLPVVTVDLPYHAPEIEYVVDGDNGLILAEGATPDEYAAAVAALLDDPARLTQLREGCARWAERLSAAEMARRFADGVEAALAR